VIWVALLAAVAFELWLARDAWRSQRLLAARLKELSAEAAKLRQREADLRAFVQLWVGEELKDEPLAGPSGRLP
jgi:cell division protein FtsB